MADGGEGNSNTSNTAPTSSFRGRGRKNFPGNRTDIGWKHGQDILGNSKKVKCNYCSKIISAGISRFKHHLAGTREDSEVQVQPINVEVPDGSSNPSPSNNVDNLVFGSNVEDPFSSGEEFDEDEDNFDDDIMG